MNTLTIQLFAEHLEEKQLWYTSPISNRAVQMVAGTLSRCGVVKRPERLRILSRLFGRTITSTRDLTTGEGVSFLKHCWEDVDEDAGWHKRVIFPPFAVLVGSL